MAANRLMRFVAAVLFVLAIAVVQGADVLGLHAEAFALAGFAAWVLADAL